jgi:hypothetical protein
MHYPCWCCPTGMAARPSTDLRGQRGAAPFVYWRARDRGTGLGARRARGDLFRGVAAAYETGSLEAGLGGRTARAGLVAAGWAIGVVGVGAVHALEPTHALGQVADALHQALGFGAVGRAAVHQRVVVGRNAAERLVGIGGVHALRVVGGHRGLGLAGHSVGAVPGAGGLLAVDHLAGRLAFPSRAGRSRAGGLARGPGRAAEDA